MKSGTLLFTIICLSCAKPDEQHKISFVDVQLPNDLSSTGGVAWVDYDGDGDDDLFLANGYDVSKWYLPPKGQADRLYQNDRGQFELIHDSPITNDTLVSSGSSWADFNNDGWIDGYLATQKHQPNALFTNLNGKSFLVEWRKSQSPIHEPNASYSANWIDADRDGWVDLFVSTGGLSEKGISKIFRNINGKRFAEITTVPWANDTLGACGGAWGDYDNDGDEDLFIPNRTGNNRFYRNNGNWNFERINDKTIESHEPHGFPASAGACWVDYNDDGQPDLSVLNQSGIANFIYKNNGNGSFTKVFAGDAGLDGGESGAQAWGDFDNDGDQDLVIGNWGSAPAFYLNDGAGHLRRSDAGALTEMLSFTGGLAASDYDNDGDLDVFLANWPNRPGPEEQNHLFKNTSATGNWLKVRLRGNISNKSAIGARVYVTASIGRNQKTMMRTVAALTCFRSQGSLTQHFGLGFADEVKELIVIWPSGKITKQANVKANQLLEIEE